MDFRDASKVNINRRLLYVLIFFLIALPVVVGVLVWYFIPKCDGKTGPNQDSVSGVTTPSVPTTPGYSETEPWKNLRLPRYIVPLHYDLTLYPDFYGDHGTFYGNVTVEIKINKDTDFLLIHYNFLNITRTEVRENSTNNAINIKRTFSHSENQFWVVETAVTLKAGATLKLSLQFEGSLTKAIVGFYKSSYVNSVTGQTRNLATSKFEPVDARRAFPCFDEPNIKAAYTITLIHDPSYTALSNMPPDGQSASVHWSTTLVATRFQRSVMMSTYLVCFIVCDFDYVEDTTSFGTTIRVYATPDKISQANYALQIGKHTMEDYTRLFKLPYPLPKQDMIAIPDFVSGAMEHWGLITYRETNLLYDPSKASAANKQRVAVVVAHEIAHQWFGNIVTMDWWDDLWLNEGFASFMEYLGVDTYEQQWEMLAQFGIEDLQPVMVTDARVESHPIVVPVYKPNEINAVFDSISYSKGAAVISMLQSIMGKDKFFQGIADYLKKFEWGNAKTDDLWQALGEVEGAPDVKHIMDTWTRQMGFPYVNVTFKPTGSGGTTVTAVQKRFLSNPHAVYDENESNYKYKWYISLSYVTSGGATGTQIMDMTDAETFDVNVDMNMNSLQWIKFNVNQTGFYRVTYPDEIWERFATILSNSNPSSFPFTIADRSAFLNDAFNLARAGLLRYDVALKMTSYLPKETSHIPWESAFTGLAYITKMFRSGGHFGSWRQFILNNVKPALDRIGWEDTGTHLDKLMRTNLIELACGHGDEHCLGNVTSKFRAWLDQDIQIPPNLRPRVYKYGMRNAGSAADWDKMFEKYQTETAPQERVNFLYALAQTKTVWLLHRYLDYANNETLIRRQDFFTVIGYINLNPVGNGILWNWARENYEKLVERFTLYSRSFGRMIPNIVSGFNTEFKLSEVEAFFKKYPEAGSGERPRKQAIETIKSNINWVRSFQGTVVKYLEANL